MCFYSDVTCVVMVMSRVLSWQCHVCCHGDVTCVFTSHGDVTCIVMMMARVVVMESW